MSFSILLKIVLTTITSKVPIWVALILAVTLAYVVTRPEPQPQTAIEYRTYWKPPIVKRPLAPTNLIQYAPVPTAELRTDTIQVPVHLTDYQLWQPSQVEQRRNSIVVRSFDTSRLTYRDYYYEPTQAKFGASLDVSAMVNAFTFAPQFELQGLLRYQRVGVFARIGVVVDEPYALVGVRYSIE
jgi:hypothetical protein